MASYLSLVAGRLRSLGAAVASAGVASAGKLVALDGAGKLDSSTVPQLPHSGLAGLSGDDHTQYYNQTRGDARYLKRGGDIASGPLSLLTQAGGALADGAGDAPFEIRAGANGGDAYMLFHSPAVFAQKFGMDSAGDLYVGSYSRGAAKYKVWRWGDHLAQTETMNIAAGAVGYFSARSSSAGTGVYILSTWPGYNAVFGAAYGAFVQLMAADTGVVVSNSVVSGKLAIAIDALYRVNVLNGLSFAMPVALWSVSRQV